MQSTPSNWRRYCTENNVAITQVGDVGKVDVLEYLAALARKGLTGVARARKVSAIREYFRYLEGVGVVQKSPTAGIDTPKREKHTRQYLRADEGFDHGVGHSLLLLYDAKAPNCQKSKEFKGLGHYPSNIALSSFCTMVKVQHLYNYLIFHPFLARY